MQRKPLSLLSQLPPLLIDLKPPSGYHGIMNATKVSNESKAEQERVNNLLGLVKFIWPEIRKYCSEDVVKAVEETIKRDGYPPWSVKVNNEDTTS